MSKYDSPEFSLFPCPKCGEFKPIAYAEGVAKKVFDEDGSSIMYFTEVDGYVVECPECGARTKHQQTLHDAVGEWNARLLIKEF